MTSVGVDAEAGPRDGSDVVRAHELLRSLILDGSLEPGRRIAQTELSRLTGAGRTPLREALRMLQQEGLVRAEVNRGVTIAPFDLDELDCLYAYRVSVEAVAIRFTVPLLTAADFEELEATMDEMTVAIEQGSRDEFELPHRRFHALLVGHVNDVVQARMAIDAERCERFRRLIMRNNQGTLVNSAREHREILDACGQGDGLTASHLLASHYARSAINVAAQLEPTYSPTLTRMAVRTVLAEGKESPRKPGRSSGDSWRSQGKLT